MTDDIYVGGPAFDESVEPRRRTESARHYRIARVLKMPPTAAIEVHSSDDDGETWVVEATFSGPNQDALAEDYLERVGVPLELFG